MYPHWAAFFSLQCHAEFNLGGEGTGRKAPFSIKPLFGESLGRNENYLQITCGPLCVLYRGTVVAASVPEIEIAWFF